MKDITASSSSNANVHVYMCKDPQFFGTIGIAWVGTLCSSDNFKGYKASINEKRESAVASAEVRHLTTFHNDSQVIAHNLQTDCGT